MPKALGQKVWRIGYFFVGSRESALQTGRYTPFLDGMRLLGYREGRDFIMEARFADGAAERFPPIARELAELRLDVIVATGSPLYPHLRRSVGSTPVVVTVTPDPVLEGIAATLARPGGNFTGLTTSSTETTVKQVELLKELIPNSTRYGILWNPTGTHHQAILQSHREAANKVGLAAVPLEGATAAQIERAFEQIRHQRLSAVIVLGDAFFVHQRRQLAELGLRYKVPALFNTREYVDAGGFLSYGIDVPENVRRAAVFVDRIIKGAKPAELPFEQPTKFEMIINLKTAKAIGLSLPPKVLFRADRVIE